MMTLKFPSLGLTTAVLTTGLLTTGLLAMVLASTEADAAVKRRHYVPKSSVNSSYQAGPHTRIFVTKRSWLDAGPEVLPGDRKFTDYATGGPDHFERLDRLNSHMDFRRSPLSTPSDVGGSPARFPLY